MIGVTGYAQHGKDSTGKFLVEEYGYTRYAFADILKSMALKLDPWIGRDEDRKLSGPDGFWRPVRLSHLIRHKGWDRAKTEPEVRRFLQVLGTEGVRDHLGENAWVIALEKQLLVDGFIATDEAGLPYPYVWPGAKVVVTDVRFPNEADWVKRMGGEMWRVNRTTLVDDPDSGDTWVRPYNNGLGTDHPSERYIAELPADRELTASNLDELGAEVERALGAGMGQ